MERDALWQDFLAESTEHLEKLSAELLRLERDPDSPEPLRQMFLSAHTIKGGAAMVGHERLRDVAHAMEDILAALRGRTRLLDRALADLLFRAVDVMRQLLAQDGEPPDEGAIAALLDALRKSAQSSGTAQHESRVPESASPSPPVRVLLLEDSATTRALEVMLLEDAAFEVDALADGLQALQKATSEVYHLLVTGIATRGLGGIELIEALRASPCGKHIRVIVLASESDPALIQRLSYLGVDRLIRRGSLAEQRLIDSARDLVQEPVASRSTWSQP